MLIALITSSSTSSMLTPVAVEISSKDSTLSPLFLWKIRSKNAMIQIFWSSWSLFLATTSCYVMLKSLAVVSNFLMSPLANAIKSS